MDTTCCRLKHGRVILPLERWREQQKWRKEWILFLRAIPIACLLKGPRIPWGETFLCSAAVFFFLYSSIQTLRTKAVVQSSLLESVHTGAILSEEALTGCTGRQSEATQRNVQWDLLPAKGSRVKNCCTVGWQMSMTFGFNPINEI